MILGPVTALGKGNTTLSNNFDDGFMLKNYGVVFIFLHLWSIWGIPKVIFWGHRL